MNHYISGVVLALSLGSVLVSCDDLLDQEPPSYLTPESYFKTEDQVMACANSFYNQLPSHGYGYGLYSSDVNTDNQAGSGSDSKYLDGQWKVGLTNGNWDFSTIRAINYKLNTCLTNYNNKKITGKDKNIRQYLGELYFFRAWEYFGKLRLWGDYPILTAVQTDNEPKLLANDKRSPRNEVARFIIANLDTAMTYMSDNFEKRHTRVSRDVAMLVKSRVALYEGTFLNYFKGTAFVPNGEGWPGKTKDYNANYQYPSGNIDNEIKYFLTTAAEAAETVAEKYKGSLTANNGVVPQKEGDSNPYFEMFGTTDMSKYDEVLLWREYNASQGHTNIIEDAVQRNNYGTGVTRSMVESFLMEDGKPIYAEHDGFVYDDNSVSKVAEHRDPRLKIFLKTPGQINCFKNMDYAQGDRYINVEPAYPDITNGDAQNWLYVTGYCLRKGGTFDRKQCQKDKSANASCAFRAREALLNYMEAEYELTKNVNSGKILSYWKTVRECAGFTGSAADPMTTINATDMSREDGDWGAYSAGKKLTDAVLYNIRRERKSELVAEGLRWMDLQRWRSLDQLMANPVHIEGINLWGSDMHNDAAYSGKLVYDGDGSGKSATTSSPRLSNYLRPQEINTTNNSFLGGLTWHMAHYLEPLPIRQFLLTASDHATVENSVLYQNPYWPTVAGHAAEK